MSTNTVGRIRQAKNRKLEKYVKVQIHNGNEYYMLKHPKMLKSRSFGADLARANAAAIAINAHFANATDDIQDILQASSPAPAHSLAYVIDAFKDRYLPIATWSERYRTEQFTRLSKIRKVSGKARFAHLGIGELKSIIFDNFTGDGVRHAKNTLIHLYKFAVGEGFSDKTLTNYAEKVNIPAKQKRQRARIANYQDYLATFNKAEPWLQDAMAISLITLQARSEICAMRLKDIDGDVLRVIRQKTGAHIEIEICKDLKKILHRCRIRAMQYGSPFIINYKSRVRSANKEHRCQVLPDYLSRAFSDISPTTFHEIRSLGVRVYEAMGMEKSWIQNLTGHSDEKMVELYAEGDQVEWISAKASMDLSQVAALKIKE